VWLTNPFFLYRLRTSFWFRCIVCFLVRKESAEGESEAMHVADFQVIATKVRNAIISHLLIGIAHSVCRHSFTEPPAID